MLLGLTVSRKEEEEEQSPRTKKTVEGYEVRGREDLDDAALGGSVSWKGLFL